MNILFLDDNPDRTKRFMREFNPTTHAITCVETAAECINQLKQARLKGEHWDAVYLDHDLDGKAFVDSSDTNTGMEVVRWIVEHKPIIKQVLVHSHNEPAGKEMVLKLRDAGYRNTHYTPFYSIFRDYTGI